MTEKELRRLSRQDLLQLLLVQSRDVARLKESAEELKNALSEERELCERLKGKLNEKDETLERLKERLNDKDATISRLKTRLDDKDEKLRILIETRGGSVPAEWLLDRSGAPSVPENSVMPEERLPAANEKGLRFRDAEEKPDPEETEETFSESVEERLRRLKSRIADGEAAGESRT